MKRFPLIIASVLLLGGLIACGALTYVEHNSKPANDFETAQVKLGDVVSKIDATGTLEPEEVIDVGAQVAGQILSFGKDADGKPIDYGSHVKQGTVLAQIDTSLNASDVAEAQATLAQAQANVQRAEADLGQMRAKLEEAENDWKRAQELGPSNALAQTSYDSYKAAYETAKANLAVGEAVVVQNKGAVVQAQAALDRAQRNLTEMSSALSSTTTLMTNLLLCVALISLVVGGVGIMNIMLVSVTERTREIGLRMAVGARVRDILRQFLIEAVLLCLAGGVFGILLGRGSSYLVAELLKWPTELSIAAIVAAVAVSAGVGIVFGYYPAWKASHLDPIDALRYE